MTTDRELMQQALKELEKLCQTFSYPPNSLYDIINALRARLAQPEQKHSEQWWRHEVSNAYANGYEKGRASVKQPEQEPVATLFGSLPVYDVSPKRRKPPTQDLSAPLTVNGVPMYPQREWQTLTDEEMFSLWVKCPAETEDRFAFARAIEQALKEKNNG